MAQLESDAQLAGQAALTPLHRYGAQPGLAPELPRATTVQAPREPATLQESQPPAQAVSQQ